MKIFKNRYIASAGESWDSIAHDIFGDEKYAAEIICVNPEIDDRARMRGGEAVKIPRQAITTTEETAPWRR